MESIRAFAFDIDGTLYPNRAMYRKSWRWALNNASRLRRLLTIRKFIRRTRPDPQGDFHRMQAQLMAQGTKKTAEAMDSWIQQVVYRNWESNLDESIVFPGTKELLMSLKERGYPLAAMSDFPVDTKLQTLGLDGIFDVVMSSESIGYLKPQPEPFLALAEALRVEPQHIVYVGNSERYDVEGAVAVGMQAVYLSSKGKASSLALGTISDFEDLIALLHQWGILSL